MENNMTYTATYEVYGEANFLHEVEETIEADGFGEACELASLRTDELADDEQGRYGDAYRIVSVSLASLHDENGIRVA